jgi:hypothetical protein
MGLTFVLETSKKKVMLSALGEQADAMHSDSGQPIILSIL